MKSAFVPIFWLLIGTVQSLFGPPARVSQFPYQAGLQWYKKNESGWCGGALISKSFVLTAAECVFGIDRFDVSLGSINRNKLGSGSLKFLNLTSDDVSINDFYNPSNKSSNIALIKLFLDVEATDVIGYVHLTKSEEILSSTQAIATGWGGIYNDDPGELLRSTLVKAVQAQSCHIEVGFSWWTLNPDETCFRVYNYDESLCVGDLGGPLITYYNGKQVLLGVFQYMSTCKLGSSLSGLFTKVSAYLEWIEKVSGVKAVTIDDL